MKIFNSISVIALSLCIGFSSLNIFFSFTHSTDFYFAVACNEGIEKHIPELYKQEYLLTCSNYKEAQSKILNVSLLVGISAFLLFIGGLQSLFSQIKYNRELRELHEKHSK